MGKPYKNNDELIGKRVKIIEADFTADWEFRTGTILAMVQTKKNGSGYTGKYRYNKEEHKTEKVIKWLHKIQLRI